MGFDDHLGSPGLILGLGFPSNNESSPKKLITKPEQSTVAFEPSLTLGFSGETYQKVDHDEGKGCDDHEDGGDLCRQDSGASCFSNVSVMKRERENGSEEMDQMGRVDEDDDGPNGRKKLRLSKIQSALLEESFKHHSTLNPNQKQELARELNLRPRQVEVWFQNRRARTKLKQTEVDCEFLKKCCETLTDENRRLHKELQELKALKLAQPFYMQLPAATLTMCPSCERVGGAGENGSKTPFAMASKPQIYSRYANQSATC